MGYFTSVSNEFLSFQSLGQKVLASGFISRVNNLTPRQYKTNARSRKSQIAEGTFGGNVNIYEMQKESSERATET